MSHHTARESYRKLTGRLNRFPQGAPPTELLFQILEVLFTPAEAELVSLLPIKPFTASTAAQLWKKSEAEARKILEALAARGGSQAPACDMAKPRIGVRGGLS